MHFQALGLDVRSTGLATALPYILAVGVKFVAGPLYDKSSFLSERTRILLFSVASQGIMIICFLLLSWVSSLNFSTNHYIKTNTVLVAHIAYMAAIVFSGLNIVGTIKCAQLVSEI